MGKNFKFILIGLGSFGIDFWCRIIVPQFRDFADAVAVVDINPAQLEKARQTGVLSDDSKYYTDARQALSENPCDFIVLATRPEHRMPLIDLAVEFGVHVLSEKPIADTMENACEIYRKIKTAKLKMAVCMNHRFSQNKQSLEMLIQSGDYGRLNYIVGRLASHRRRPRTEGVDYVSRFIAEGVIHEFDTFRGMARSNAKSVYAQVWPFDAEDGFAGSCFAQVTMENGVRCVIEHSSATAANHNDWGKEYYRAECEKATLIMDKFDLSAKSDLGFPNARQSQLPLIEASYWSHSRIGYDFCQWLSGGPASPTNLDDNMNCCALTFAAVESAKTGTAVDVTAFFDKYKEKYGII